MIDKNDLIELIAIKFANDHTQDELLLIAEAKHTKTLEKLTRENILKMATQLKILPHLNCGITGHISDCACTRRWPTKLPTT